MMAKSFLGYLHRRGSTFYFRRGIPALLRPCFGMRELFWSLGPLAQHQAEQLALHSFLFTEEIFAEAKSCSCFPDPDRFNVLVDDFKHRLRDRHHRLNNQASHSSASLHMRSERLWTPVPTGVNDELCIMTGKYGIDPRLKAELQSLLQSLVELGLFEFENAILTNPSAIPLTALEQLRGQLGNELADPTTASGAFPPDSALGRFFELVWNKHVDLGSSDPIVARNYGQREFRKAACRLLDDCKRSFTDPTFSSPAGWEAPPGLTALEPATTVSPTVSTAWEEYVEEKGLDWSDNTRREYERTIAEFTSIEFIGDKVVSELRREDLIHYRNLLRRLPAGRNKMRAYREKSVAELLKMDIPRKYLLQDRTINERLILLGTFFAWCREVKRYMDRDLSYKVQITKPVSKGRSIFTPEELTQLFDPAHYRPRLVNSPFKYWVPLLALYTGARLSELAQLAAGDIVEVDGIPAIRITDEGDTQKVKTQAGKRLVPVHAHLLQLGFPDYVTRIRQQKSNVLFPDLTHTEGKPGIAVSKWFTDFRRRRGVRDEDSLGKEKVFHSFRHTVVTRLRHHQLPSGEFHPVPVIQQIVGHEKSLDGATDIYTQDFPLGMCRAVINTLDYGLDLEGLRKAWLEVWSKRRRH